MPANAEEIIKRNNSLKNERATWDTLWQDIADYVVPRKSDITEEKTADVEGFTDQLYDTTATEANMTLAAGQFDYLISGRWFEYAPPEELKDFMGQDGKDWYRKCSEIALRELNRSNFALEMHEMFLDRGGFGTAAISLEEGRRHFLKFENQEIGSYSIDEDDEKYVDTVYREFQMTARQAALKFGEENLGKTIRKCLQDGHTGKDADKKFTFIHAVYPRPAEDQKEGGKSGSMKPIASVYVDCENKVIVRESGFDEMPFAVTRYLRWGREKYGYCPSVVALPNVRGVNFNEKFMDALGELAAFPRILIPEGMEGDVDLRSSGITLFDPNNPSAMPKEWQTQGRYDIGVDRSNQKRDFINRAYHTDLFKALAEKDKTMTATEVLELVEEKLVNFSPTFSRQVVELFDPILSRVFKMLYRAGKFPDPPSSVLVQVEGETDPKARSIRLPEVTYVSKLAMAMKALENKAFFQFVEAISMLVGLKPEMVDLIHGDRSARKIAENLGVSVEFLSTEEEMADTRQARAAQQQQAQALEAAKTGSEVAKNMKDVPEAMRSKLNP